MTPSVCIFSWKADLTLTNLWNRPTHQRREGCVYSTLCRMESRNGNLPDISLYRHTSEILHILFLFLDPAYPPPPALMRAYKKRSRVFRSVLLQQTDCGFSCVQYLCKYPAMAEAEIVMSKIMQTCLYICFFTLIIFRFLMCPTYGPQAVDKRSTLLPTAQLYCMTVVCLQKQNVSFNFVHIQPRKTNTAAHTHTHTKLPEMERIHFFHS